MDSRRLFERIAEYKKALARLQQALQEPENELIRDAVIQRFEFTFELAWKTIKLYLEFQNIEVRSPRDTLREALKLGLIDDGNVWSLLLEKRNLTSHTYDENLAIEVYQFVKYTGVRLFLELESKIELKIGNI
ncbi:MAG: nucleotidyltransferase substrate binding protein [Deltaproteobacteria bacterium]|nr:nucleotidyltransferase substrate binding protein [Deltaproteobacteria bacterium]